MGLLRMSLVRRSGRLLAPSSKPALRSFSSLSGRPSSASQRTTPATSRPYSSSNDDLFFGLSSASSLPAFSSTSSRSPSWTPPSTFYGPGQAPPLTRTDFDAPLAPANPPPIHIPRLKTRRRSLGTAYIGKPKQPSPDVVESSPDPFAELDKERRERIRLLRTPAGRAPLPPTADAAPATQFSEEASWQPKPSPYNFPSSSLSAGNGSPQASFEGAPIVWASPVPAEPKDSTTSIFARSPPRKPNFGLQGAERAPYQDYKDRRPEVVEREINTRGSSAAFGLSSAPRTPPSLRDSPNSFQRASLPHASTQQSYKPRSTLIGSGTESDRPRHASARSELSQDVSKMTRNQRVRAKRSLRLKAEALELAKDGEGVLAGFEGAWGGAAAGQPPLSTAAAPQAPTTTASSSGFKFDLGKLDTIVDEYSESMREFQEQQSPGPDAPKDARPRRRIVDEAKDDELAFGLAEEKEDVSREKPKGGGPVLESKGDKKGVDLFLGLGVNDDIVDALRQDAFSHITRPTRFQKQFLSTFAHGQDLVAQLATGQGKTFSVLLALLSLFRNRRRFRETSSIKNQASALFVVPSPLLAYQVLSWASLLVPPEELSSAIRIFDPYAPSTFMPKDARPPLIVLTIPSALTPENVSAMRALSLRTIVIDEADSVIWPNHAEEHNDQLVRTIERMLHSAIVNSPGSNEKKKPQVVIVGSTVSPKLMKWLKETRDWIRPSAVVLVQPTKDDSRTSSKGLIAKDLPESTSYSKRSPFALGHHVIVVSPSGRYRDLASPAPAVLEPPVDPSSETSSDALPSYLIDAFKSLYCAALPSKKSEETTLLVLKNDAQVEDTKRQLASVDISSTILGSFEEPSSPATSTTAPTNAELPTLLLTTTSNCRGLDIPSLTTVYTFSDAIRSASDYVHISGRLARLGSRTIGGGAGGGVESINGRVIVLLRGDTMESPCEKEERVSAMGQWLTTSRKKKGKLSPGGGREVTEEEGRMMEELFPEVNYELEKVKLALATVEVEAEALPR